ncbi:MAG: ChaN family lipoprotein [Planctomycetota bacterium]
MSASVLPRTAAVVLLAVGAAACAGPRALVSDASAPPAARRGAGRTPVELVPAGRVPGSSGRYSIRRTPADERVTVEAAAGALASADAIFLGELHNSTEGHAAQLALTEAIARRRGEVILSMEMLERDARPRVALYLSGAIDRENFLEGTRLWGNWAEHYEPAFNFARDNGFEVVSANVYRPLASRVAADGLAAGLGDVWSAKSVDTRDGEYKRRFREIMSGTSHGAPGGDLGALDRVFAAQCLKDDTMAESIADALRRRGDGAPPVVHWNGRFHSDFGLGTVERLRRRMPGLNIAVVSMLEADDLGADVAGEDLDTGHFVVVVPRLASRRR